MAAYFSSTAIILYPHHIGFSKVFMIFFKKSKKRQKQNGSIRSEFSIHAL